MPRTMTAPAREDSRQELIRSSTDRLFALKPTRERAIENDYCESLHRSVSDPFAYAHATKQADQVTVSAMPRRSTGGSRTETGGRPYLCHNPTKPPPIARELKPGYARRVVAPPPLLPRVSLTATQTMSGSAVGATIGAFSSTHTISTSSPRTLPQNPSRCTSVALVTKNNTEFESETNGRRVPVREQPRSIVHSKCSKQFLVELDANSTAKSRCGKSKKLTAAGRPDCKSSRRVSVDSDHVLIEVSDGKAKPGEHAYPCPRCGKCMCPYCKGEKRNKSRKLLCNGRFLCNTDSVVDALTCFCCVRACFYHCSNRDNDELCTVKPCSCQESNRCVRWASIVALTPLLPCLLCYPVARGCVRMCNACNEYLKPGCKCKESNR